MADLPQTEKSTSVRLIALRAVFRLLCTAAPALAARLAGVLFRTPPRHRHSETENGTLSKGERLDLALDGRRLAVWRWGSGPMALLVHGWGSRGARLVSFVEPLTAAGFSVVAFDAPGHGDSAGRLSSLPQYIAAIEEIVRRLGPPEAVVAHSMGGAASAIAMKRGLSPKAAVFVAPAANPAEWTGRFASLLGISDAVIGRMMRRFERRFGYRWSDFDVPRVAAPFSSVPLLVFHDEKDAEVPAADGKAIASAWPGAQFVSTHDLGHKRIVHDPDVIRRGVEFLTAHAGGPAREAAARLRRKRANGRSSTSQGDSASP